MQQLMALNGNVSSPLCFGCMQFGGTADERDSEAMFRASRETGINFFDTAHMYTAGASEELLGQFITNDREQLIVATKAGYSGGSGRENILRTFDISRQRLGLDVVDILYLHRWDEDTPLEETFETLAGLQASGRVRYIGVSNFAAWQVMKAQAVAACFDTRIDILQPMYSLVKRQAEVEILPMALSEGIAVASYSPLGGGLLTGKYLLGGTGRLLTDERYTERYAPDWMHQASRSLFDLASDVETDPATLAVAWAARHAGITAPIISARNVEQLTPSLAAARYDLSDELYDRMSRLTPAPAPATDRLEEG